MIVLFGKIRKLTLHGILYPTFVNKERYNCEQIVNCWHSIDPSAKIVFFVLHFDFGNYGEFGKMRFGTCFFFVPNYLKN